MPSEELTLRSAFLEDHRHLTQGLSRLLGALDKNDVPAAAAIAEELDRVAGPHIEFEERVFSPHLAETLGPTFVNHLYQEHQAGLNALKALVGHATGEAIEPAQQAELKDQVKMALDHATICGTLLSQVTRVDPDREKRLLDDLREFRRRGHRWTELEHDAAFPASGTRTNTSGKR